MLELRSGKKITTENIDAVKIFNPQWIKRQGNTRVRGSIEEITEKLKQNHASGAKDDGETFETFSDRVFELSKIDARAAKRLWYKRHEVMARMNEWIYGLNLENYQEHEVRRDTDPDTLFYNRDGDKRTFADVKDKIRELKAKQQELEARVEDNIREHQDRQDHQDRVGDQNRPEDRDRQGQHDRPEHRQHAKLHITKKRKS
jgi:hypothetical protein